MEKVKIAFKDTDAYIATFPKSTQKLLEQLRKTIKKAAPKAEELISYNMPAYKYNGVLVYFAAYERHIGFYPTASGIKVFQKEISSYKNSKGAVQFPLDKPLPLALITSIVQYRAQENEEKAYSKKKPKVCSEGHSYYKTSDCPTCPICEKNRKPQTGFLSLIAAPARRALESKKISTLKQLANCTEAELLALHGFGKASLPLLRKALKKEGLSFRTNKQKLKA